MNFFRPLLAFLADSEFYLHISQVASLMTFISLGLFLGKRRLCLLNIFYFVFYWGIIFHGSRFAGVPGDNLASLYIYASTGISMLTLSLLGYLREPGDRRELKLATEGK